MKRLRDVNGCSLLEVLASLTIFAIIASGLAAGTVATIKGNSASRETSVASALIHDKMEQFRALDPAAGPADLAPGNHDDPLNPLTPLGETGGGFTRSWTVTPNTPRAGVSEVVVTVSWYDPEHRSLSAATYTCQTTTCS